jgi:DNA-binding transcriptional LysR family regulator
VVSHQITIRHLRAFVAVADELHFGRAAAELNLTSSALSQTLRQLEVAVGTTLVRRTTRQVELTSAGISALESARFALSSFDAALVRMQEAARGEAGVLRVGYVIGAGLELMPAVMRAFQHEVPAVEVKLREYDFSRPDAGLELGEVDLAFLRPPLRLDDVEYLPLLKEPRVACLPEGHPLAGREKVRVRELLGEPIIAAPTDDEVWRGYWILGSEREGRPANVVLEAPTFEAELQAVASGQGISTTGLTAARYYARPGVRFSLISDLAPCEIVLAWRPPAQGVTERFVDVARRVKSAYDETRPAPEAVIS